MQRLNFLRPACRRAPLAVGLLLAGCAAESGFQSVASESWGSPSFTVSRPAVYKAGDGLELTGRLCRRAGATALSPPAVRLEHVGADGQVVGTAMTRVRAIYRSADQPCAPYATKVDWTLGAGDRLRACLDRGRPCPAAPTPFSPAAITAPHP